MEVDEFLSQLGKLIEEGKDEEAEKLVKEFAKGKEDDVAGLLFEIGVDVGNKNRHEEASYYFDFARGITKSKDLIEYISQNYAEACLKAGNYYWNLSEKKDKEINLKKSLIAFQKASKIFTEKEFLLEYAKIEGGLGNVFLGLAEVKDKEKNLDLAINVYKNALRIFTEEAFPVQYATTQNNLGNTYSELAEVRDKEKNLGLAIKAYENALKIYTEEAFPEGYAMAQNNLGLTYQALAEVGNKEENLELVVKACENALRIYTEEAYPVKYAMTQNNLGIIYSLLSEVKNKEENLHNAITAYENTLRIITEEAYPFYYAMAQNNLGNAYGNLAGTKNTEENLGLAVKAYINALRVRTEEAYPFYYATTQNNLGNAYLRLAEVMDKEKNLEFAIEAYENAIRADPVYIDHYVNLGHLLFITNDYDGARNAFQRASEIYAILKLKNQSKEMKAYSFWMEARLLWDKKQWESSKDCYIAASNIFLECQRKELADVLKVMSEIIFISRDYRNAINSETIIEVKQKISNVFDNFSKVFDQIKEIEFPDFELVKAQFECIGVLNRALNFESYSEESIENARNIFKKYNFITPLFAVNSLENFVIEFKEKYGNLERILPEEERNLLIALQPCDALDGVISKEVDRRASEKYPPEILKEIREIKKGQEEMKMELRELKETIYQTQNLLIEKDVIKTKCIIHVKSPFLDIISPVTAEFIIEIPMGKLTESDMGRTIKEIRKLKKEGIEEVIKGIEGVKEVDRNLIKKLKDLVKK